MLFYKERKLFPTIKTKSQRNRKIGIFPKRLVHGFGKNIENFFFFLGKIGQENVFDDILVRRKLF